MPLTLQGVNSQRDVGGWFAYGESKLANLLFAQQVPTPSHKHIRRGILSRPCLVRLGTDGNPPRAYRPSPPFSNLVSWQVAEEQASRKLFVNAAHPGLVASNFARQMPDAISQHVSLSLSSSADSADSDRHWAQLAIYFSLRCAIHNLIFSMHGPATGNSE